MAATSQFRPLSDLVPRVTKKFLSKLGSAALGVTLERITDPSVAAKIRTIRDGLGYFLETVDQCDVLFFERDGGSLVFLVVPRRRENADIIWRTLAQEHKLLDGFGIDPPDVTLLYSFIRIIATLPAEAVMHH